MRQVWIWSLVSVVSAVRNLQIATPLQALTIWDPEVTSDRPPSFRARFLAKFRAGLHAEVTARQQVVQALEPQIAASVSSKDWARQAETRDRQRNVAADRLVEDAYDAAVAPWDAVPPFPALKNPNRYQFVGVIAPASSSSTSQPPIVWYARPKPTRAQWSVRLVHVHRAAILKDLYQRGKIDIFAHYTNAPKAESEASDASTVVPRVAGTYTVRERSWRNLWNVSPRHVVTDSSGMYWRERRLRSGLYTDGQSVYEASYRYRDGRNGMHKISSFTDFVTSRSVPATTKQTIQQRLVTDSPDVVLEE